MAMNLTDILGLAILSSFVLLASAEYVWPARRFASPEPHRMAINFGLGVVNLALAALPLASAYGGAVFARDHDLGLFNHIGAPGVLIAIITFLVLSLVGYAVHALYHRVDWLWAWHRVHHHDMAVDISTTVRTHPLSSIGMSLCTAPLIMLIGPSPELVELCATIIFIGGLWHHSNIRISDTVAERLEWVIVTPRMHLVHHARDRTLHDSNYGDILSIWDRLFGTYKVRPPDFVIGVEPAAP